MALRTRSKAKGLTRLIAVPAFGVGGSSAVFAFIALVLLVFSSLRGGAGVTQTARSMVVDAFAPVLFAINQPIHQAASYVQAVTGLASLQEENLRLKQENIRLRDWYQTALLLQEQNDHLKKLLNVDLPPVHKHITAQVIADSGNAYMRSLLVTAGEKQGVKSGQPALAGDGVIGRVVDVNGKSARILLLTDINARIPVLIAGKNDRAVLAGKNDALPRLTYLPQGSAVAAGDRVITSGHGGLFPYGLPVGEVVVVDDGEGFAVRPYADMERINFVRIVDRDTDPRLIEKGE